MGCFRDFGRLRFFGLHLGIFLLLGALEAADEPNVAAATADKLRAKLAEKELEAQVQALSAAVKRMQ